MDSSVHYPGFLTFELQSMTSVDVTPLGMSVSAKLKGEKSLSEHRITKEVDDESCNELPRNIHFPSLTTHTSQVFPQRSMCLSFLAAKRGD